MSKLGYDRLCIATRERLPVEASFLGDIGDVPAADGEIAAAIAHARAYRAGRGQITRRLARGCTDEHAPIRSSLQPDQGLAVAVPTDIH